MLTGTQTPRLLFSIAQEEKKNDEGKDDEENPNEDSEENDPRVKIMKAAIAHVNRMGWTDEALAAGATDVGLPPVSQGMFTRGAAELAEYWMDTGNERLREYLEKNAEEKTDVNNESDFSEDLDPDVDKAASKELVISALFYRLEHTVPFLRSWPQAMALGLHPENVTTTVQKLSEIPDLICYYAGGKSYDDVWFTRRNAVGAIYAAAELYMLTDYSEGYEDTKAFIRRRVDDSLNVEQLLSKESNSLSAAATGVESILTAAASMVLPIATQLVKNVPTTMQESASSVANEIRNTAEKIAAAAGHQSLEDALKAADKSFRDGNSNIGIHHETPAGTDSPLENLTPVKLPDGLSLFGLVSMNAADAVEMVESNNEDFRVIVWPAEDAFESIREDKVVRLLINKNDIVVDVWRN